MVNEFKFSLVQQITAATLFPASNIADETKIRFVIEGAAGGNTVVVRARIVGQADWDVLATIVGSDKNVVNVSTYDELQVECTVYASSTNNVKVIASSFNEAGGSTTIDVPAGGAVVGDSFTLTSNDGSIVITGTPLTDTIDFSVPGAADVSDLITLTGVPAGSTDLGTFTGVTIPDNSTIKQALQALETSEESTQEDVGHLVTLSGVVVDSDDLGIFAGSIIPDSSTVKAALQSLETSQEAIQNDVGHLVTLSGVPVDSDDLGTFTGTIIPDTSTIKSAIQSLETAILSLPDPMEYKGLWDASTNTPTLTDGTGNNGDVYYVNVAGTQFTPAITFAVGDKVVYNGALTKYEKWDVIDPINTDEVPEGATNLYFTDLRAQTATISQVITNGVTTKAPSEDAVFDALALKITGPASSTDNAITRYDGTTGKLVQDSLATVSDTGVVAADDYVFTDVNFNTISTKQSVANIASTGVSDGLVLSIGTPNTTFSLSAGTAVFSTNVGSAMVKRITIAAQLNQTLTFLSTNLVTYIGLDNTGTIIQQVSPFTNVQRRTIASIGAVIHTDMTIVNAVNQLQVVSISPLSQLKDLEAGLGFFNISGNIFSPNGANLNINKSVGVSYKTGANWATSQLDPNTFTLSALPSASFQYRFQNGTSLATTTTINPGIYDVGGVSTPVPGLRFTIQRIYVFSSNLIRIQPGQESYLTLGDAIAGIQTEPFVTETNISENGLLRAFLVVRDGTTDLTDTTRARFFEAPRFGGTAGVGGVSTTSLQKAYDNSITPEIITNTLLGAFSVQRGSAADTDNVFEIKNGVSTNTATITGAGVITGSNLSGTNTGDQIAATVPNTPAGGISATTVQAAINELDTEKVSATTGDLPLSSFSAANNQVAPANVTGFAFSNAVVRGFSAIVTVTIDATSDLFEEFELHGIQRGADWSMSVESTGDESGVAFSITNAGQIQYVSASYGGFVSAVVKFRAEITNL